MDNHVWVLGLPLAPLTRAQALAAVVNLIEARQPSFFITANTHYAMLTNETPDLKAINLQAAFVLADGAPLVWASRWKKSPLPERVAGSDLIYDLCGEAARSGYRVFLLGGAEGVADEAARRLAESHPGLHVVGTESPPYRDLTPEEQDQLIRRVQSASPDILIVALTMPKGELWIAANYERLGVPLCVNLGVASTSLPAESVGPRSDSRSSAWNGPTGCSSSRRGWHPAMPATRSFCSAWPPATCCRASPTGSLWPRSRTLTEFNPPQATGR